MFNRIMLFFGQILFFLISIPIFIINIPFEIYAHYFEDGHLKPMRYPFFLKKELDVYYYSLEMLLKPYLNCEWARDILRSAEAHLKKVAQVHKAFRKSPNHLSNNQYYVDTSRTELSKEYCTDLIKSSDHQKDWAILFTKNRLQTISFQQWSDDQKAALVLLAPLKEHLEKRYKIIIEYNLCPDSFIKTLDI